MPTDDSRALQTPPADASGTPAATERPPARPPRHSTVGELRAALESLLALPDDARVFFGDGQLSFNRVVPVSPGTVQVEFNEVYSVTPDPTGG